MPFAHRLSGGATSRLMARDEALIRDYWTRTRRWADILTALFERDRGASVASPATFRLGSWQATPGSSAPFATILYHSCHRTDDVNGTGIIGKDESNQQPRARLLLQLLVDCRR